MPEIFSKGYVKGWLKYLFNHANDAVNGAGMTTGELKHSLLHLCGGGVGGVGPQTDAVQRHRIHLDCRRDRSLASPPSMGP